MSRPKIIRITTVPISLKILLKGQLRYMNENFEVVGVCSSGDEVDEVRKEEGIRVEIIEMTRQITPFKDFISLVKMIRFLRKEKPQIVHTHTPKAGIIGMLAAKLAGVPVRMHTVAGLPLMETQGLKRKILNSVEKLTYWAATDVYPNSKGLYDFILKEKLTSSQKLKIIGQGSTNGIDTQFFSPENYSEAQKQKIKQELGITDGEFIFLFIGRLVKDKGINELVSGFVQSHAKMPHSKLILVGPLESDLDPLESMTLKEIESNSHILSVGYQKDVRPYLAISNALVFPSYREGFPNVVMQAGAMGLPAIVTNINGCNEIVQENQNGILIPVKNQKAIEDAMLQLYSDTNRYQNLKVNARKAITSRFEQKEIWKALEKEYREKLEGNI